MPYFDVACTQCEWKDEVKCKYEELKEQQCRICGSVTERLYTTNQGGALGATIRGIGVYKTGTY